jgi:hypothetical protein
MTQDEAWNDKEKHSREYEKRHNKRLRALEAKVFDILTRELERYLRIEGNAISDAAGNINVNKALNDAFRAVDASHRSVMAELVRELMRGSNLSKRYFRLLASPQDRFDLAQERALRYALQSWGIRINDEGKAVIQGGGFLNTLLEDNFLRKQVQSEAMRAVLGGGNFQDLKSRIRTIVRGAPGRTGAFERYYNVHAYDFLMQVDRKEMEEYAKSLKLQAFVYAGTTIGETRHFCREKVGEVFLVSETKKWKRQRWSGKPKNGYAPMRDLGGYNCRHVARFISNRRAAEKRDDLYVDDNGELQKR